MDYSLSSLALNTVDSDCIIVGLYEDQSLSPSAQTINDSNQGIITQLIERGDIQGKTAETLLINNLPNSSLTRVLLVGLGHKKSLTAKSFRKALSASIAAIKSTAFTSISCTLVDIDVNNNNAEWKTRQIIEMFDDAVYQFVETKSDKKIATALERVQIIVTSDIEPQAAIGLQQGVAIAKGITLAKHLADLPGNFCTPSFLADNAMTIAAASDKMDVEILEESDMEALGMGSFLAVSRGSRQPAKLIVLNYQGGAKDSKPIVLVGKGLTFDAGGISLKPGAGMDEMKYDMCGGASVLGTLQAAAEMNLPINIVGIVPSSENMPDGDANKPGDVLTSMSGLTIEILNTDAEGRLILCDALTYAKKFNPEVVIDLATLTGACLVALGRVPSGLLGNDDDLCNDLIAASETACDSLWRLPIWDEYHEQLKSNFADLANIGGRDAGTITAACFLSRFTEDYRWAHLDIAGTAWRSGGANKGATGRPVPLLTQYLIDRANG